MALRRKIVSATAQLFLRRFQCEQNLGVPDRNQILGHPCLHLLMQVEQSHRVGHRRPASTDLLRDLFLAHSKFAGEPRVTLRFFDRIEIGALQIFDQRELEHFAIVRRSNNDRHLGQSCVLRCAPAAFTGDQFVTAIDLADDQRLDDSVLPDRFDQLRERIRAEFLPRLQWTWRDAVETDLPNFFGLIIGQGGNGRRRCRLSGNERAETFAESRLLPCAEIIGTNSRNANSSLRHFAALNSDRCMAAYGHARRFTLGHSPDPDDAFMFYAMAENKIDLRGYRFEHRLEDIQTLNERAHARRTAYFGDLDSRLRLRQRQVCAAALRSEHGRWLRADGDRETTPNAERRTSNAEEARAITQSAIAVPGTMTSAFLALQLYLGEFNYVVVPFDQIFEAVQTGAPTPA